MKSNLKNKLIIITLGIGQSNLANIICDAVSNTYYSDLEKVFDRAAGKMHLCFDKPDVNLSKKNKKLAEEAKHFCKGMRAFSTVFDT